MVVGAAVAAVAVTIVTCGAGSVTGTIAITIAITMGSKAIEVGSLQYKKRKQDGDSESEIFSDIVDSLWKNFSFR